MGLNVYSRLIVGVPLLDLGDIVEDEKEVGINDWMGRPTGGKVTLRKVWLVTQNGKFEVGSNMGTMGGRVQYSINGLFSSRNERDTWAHCTDNEGGPEAWVIGLEIGDRATSHISKLGMSNIEDSSYEVMTRLRNRFGYEGQIYTIALSHLSY